MACLEHSCTQCDWVAFDNSPPGPGAKCPKCGARVITFCDEFPEPRVDHHDEPPEEDGDE
jgi:DNA-directed RNA polymerase subunit RPC12/RpoP